MKKCLVLRPIYYMTKQEEDYRKTIIENELGQQGYEVVESEVILNKAFLIKGLSNSNFIDLYKLSQLIKEVSMNDAVYFCKEWKTEKPYKILYDVIKSFNVVFMEEL